MDEIKEPKPQTLGEQIPCGVHSEVSAEGVVREVEEAPWRGVS